MLSTVLCALRIWAHVLMMFQNLKTHSQLYCSRMVILDSCQPVSPEVLLAPSIPYGHTPHGFKNALTHRMVRLKQTPGGHLDQPHCSNRAIWSQMPKTTSSQVLNTSKDRLCNLSGCTLPVLDYTHSKKFAFVQLASPVFEFVPTASGLVTGLFTVHHFRCFLILMKSPWVVYSPRLTVTDFAAFLQRRDAPVPSSALLPFTRLSQVYPCLSCTREPKTGLLPPAVSEPHLLLPDQAQLKILFTSYWFVASDVPTSVSVQWFFTETWEI